MMQNWPPTFVINVSAAGFRRFPFYLVNLYCINNIVVPSLELLVWAGRGVNDYSPAAVQGTISHERTWQNLHEWFQPLDCSSRYPLL